MRTHFEGLVDFLFSHLNGEEVCTATFQGEESDFVRMNQARVRQPGHVRQQSIELDLIEGGRHAGGSVTLSGVREEDEVRLTALVKNLRGALSEVPEDPHLLYATEVRSTEQIGENGLPEPAAALDRILSAAEGHDLVGIYASGGIHRGFANSFGQRNWYSSWPYHLDFSIYLKGDKAVKSSFGGFEFDGDAVAAKIEAAAEQLVAMGRPSRKVPPGEYRVYLAPAAVSDYLGMLGWGGFGLKARETKQTTLLKMVEGGARLHPSVTLTENTAGGIAPNFQRNGFLRPDRVDLITRGELRDPLVSPRSSREFGVPTNGANDGEAPESLEVAAGDLPADEILSRLDTGILINNLHYLNYSDRPAARVTGLTRFACFWVEGGEIVAPLDVMRFDETILRAFGENLLGLTREREMILESGSYGGRSTTSSHVPGALIEGFRFNL